MDIIQRLGEKYESMTECDKKIYQYIMNNVLAASLKSINDISEELEISKTSLMRFAKSLGFNGYSQFKKTLQEEQILSSSPGDRMKKLYESDYIMSAEKTKNQEIENINNTFMNIDDEKFNKLVEMIMNDNRIFTLGWNLASYLSSIFCYRLNHLGFNCVEMKRDVIDFDNQIMHIKKDEVVVIFEFYKYSKSVERAAEIANKKGAKILLITDDLSCPVCKYSEHVFLSNTKTDLLMNSLIGPMFFINLIVSELVYRLDDKVIKIFDERFEIMKKSGEYY